MTVTYSGDLSIDLDMVRFRLGDTDTTSALLTDEEIAYWLDTANYSVEQTIGRCARACLMKVAQRPRSASTPDGASASYGDERVSVWRELVAMYDPDEVGRGFRIRKVAKPQLIDEGEYT